MRTWAIAGVWLLVGCGGRVSDAGDEASARDGAAGGGAVGRQVELPPCEPGPFPHELAPGGTCAWLDHEGRCYDEKLEACGCACRANGGEQCLSQLPSGPDGRVPVDCY